MCSEEIILEIEDTPIVCKKEELIAHSDYFKAMLEGNFIESSKRVIRLEGVDLRAMNIILTLLWDESYLIQNEDILIVLQAACMLQFVNIRNICLEQIIEMLSPKNCIKIWHVTEQLNIKPLFLNAKAMALEEFLEIKDTDCILELSLEEIYYYLGHIHLKTDNELSVFQTAMKWWYENNSQCVENPMKNLLKLLSCVDYQSLLDNYLRETMTYPDIASNLEVTQILSCILQIKNGHSVADFSEVCQERARLLYNSKSRMSPVLPCILVNFIQLEGKNKKAKVSKEQDYVVYYDHNLREFKRLFDIDGQKCHGLDGFKLVGYKEFAFMYGGEFLIGKGNWNYNFWVFDTIRERWERKCVLPFPRRHFETCMVGTNLYIIGGTGVFRVIQENMFWYNYKEDKWSTQIMLPFPGRQLKCCNFLNQLFILNISNKCGFFFNEKTFVWKKMEIAIDDGVINNLSDFSIFSYKNSLYIKGKSLIEFVVMEKEIVLISIKDVTNIVCDKMELVLCNNIVYTFYKYRYEDNDTYSLEIYNLETGDIDFVFKDAPSDTVIDIDGNQFIVSSSLKIFAFQHHNLVEDNILVNNCFE
ncbi:hypothetical protein NQ314_007700 [Rhamnusium bicolor]|uniref:BTB domain-containing protein n=1 Tax=Rhamnusium bicolor TaxID=1586634 RepID=A0AAV8YKV8_9CUCU|nr:hypothetical protein NQ314_007700 [Rhamnusium bicolor]